MILMKENDQVAIKGVKGKVRVPEAPRGIIFFVFKFFRALMLIYDFFC